MVKKVTLDDESYWKLRELKTKFRKTTWKELIEEMYKRIGEE